MRIALVLWACFTICLGKGVQAAELVLVNESTHPITCTAAGREDIRIAAGGTQHVVVTDPNAPLSVIDCGGRLRARALSVTASGTDRILIFNGTQQHVLNALLYSAIPTDPDKKFMPLVSWVARAYQAEHPDILLNIVMDPNVDDYSFESFDKRILGDSGLDVAEVDTVFLRYLKESHLILPVQVPTAAVWPVAHDAVMIDGTSYGIPSWLCTDFLFSLKPEDAIRTFTQMLSFFSMGQADHILSADLNGKWTISALYLQAYKQMYPSRSLAEAVKAAADKAVINRLVRVGNECESSGGNPCIDNTFHNMEDNNPVERHFDEDHRIGDIGFSERSFYLDYYAKTRSPLYLIPVPWGDKAQTASHLIYVDAFVINAKTCRADPCRSEAADFGRFMTSPSTKKQIVLSRDLGGTAPPRHLLPASRLFYEDADVREEPIYAQVRGTLLSGNVAPYLNNVTPKSQFVFLNKVCSALKEASPQWDCKVPRKPPDMR